MTAQTLPSPKWNKMAPLYLFTIFWTTESISVDKLTGSNYWQYWSVLAIMRQFHSNPDLIVRVIFYNNCHRNWQIVLLNWILNDFASTQQRKVGINSKLHAHWNIFGTCELRGKIFKYSSSGVRAYCAYCDAYLYLYQRNPFNTIW